MKKIITLSLALVAVIALLSSGTWAYFNDAVTISTNTITAGTLLIDSSSTVTPINLSSGNGSKQIQPGDRGSAASWILQNSGNLAGITAISMNTFAEAANTSHTYPAGISSYSAALGYVLKMVVWADTNGNGLYDSSSDYCLGTDGIWTQPTGTSTIASVDSPATSASGVPDSAYNTIESYSGIDSTASSIASQVLPVNGTSSTSTLHIDYYFPDHGKSSFNAGTFTGIYDNSLQGASVTFNAVLTLIQKNRAATTASVITILSDNASLAAPHVGAYSKQLSAIGGVASSYSWTVTSGAFTNTGLSLATTGKLTGTATAGSDTVTVQVTDGTNTITKSLTVTVSP